MTETGIRSAIVQVAGSVHSCFLADEVAAALTVDVDSCMFTAGFACDHAIRAVFLMIRGRPKIFAIMVEMTDCGRARRRHRQLHVHSWFCCDDAPRAVSHTVPRSCRQRQFTPKAGCAGYDAPRLCSSRLSQAQDFQHLGRYGPEGQLRSWYFAANRDSYAQCKLCGCSPRGDGTGAVQNTIEILPLQYIDKVIDVLR